MNSRQRFLETMRYGAPDRAPIFGEGIRREVLRAWKGQGLALDGDLAELFAIDRREEMELDLDPHPPPKEWPVSLSQLDGLRRSLHRDTEDRLPEDLPDHARAGESRDYVLMLEAHQGFFLSMGVTRWQRFADVVRLLIDDPPFVHESMALQGELAARLVERVLRKVRLDAAVFSEPIGGNDRPLISPGMFEEFILRSYEPLLALLKGHGVETLVFRTYANARVLIPSILRQGFNTLWACEVNTQAMDYRDLRREFGRDLRLIGGIDLDVLRRGKEAIRREVEEKVPPLLAEGGYAPLADGRVREDVPFENYAFYRRLLEKVTREAGGAAST